MAVHRFPAWGVNNSENYVVTYFVNFIKIIFITKEMFIIKTRVKLFSKTSFIEISPLSIEYKKVSSVSPWPANK